MTVFFFPCRRDFFEMYDRPPLRYKETCILLEQWISQHFPTNKISELWYLMCRSRKAKKKEEETLVLKAVVPFRPERVQISFSGMSPDLDIPLMFAIVWGHMGRGPKGDSTSLLAGELLCDLRTNSRLSNLWPQEAMPSSQVASLGILGIYLPWLQDT